MLYTGVKLLMPIWNSLFLFGIPKAVSVEIETAIHLRNDLKVKRCLVYVCLTGMSDV